MVSKAEGGKRKAEVHGAVAPRAANAPSCSFRLPPSAFRLRSGISLLELLIVIVVVLSLTAAAIPIIAPALANRRTREAARVVNVFFSAARNRAMHTRRPVGVIIERQQGLPEAAITLSYCEVPPPYAGDSISSRATTVEIDLDGDGVKDDGAITNLSGDSGWTNTIRKGDLIKFNYQGHLYRLDGPDAALDASKTFYMVAPAANAPWHMTSVTAPSGMPFRASPSAGLPYQIFRAPIKLAAGAVQLPETVAIDLGGSGFDTAAISGDSNRKTGTWAFEPHPLLPSSQQDTTSVIITFNPSGSVDRVYCWDNEKAFAAPPNGPQWKANNPQTPIHLLIGRRDFIPSNLTATGTDPIYNWEDLNALWVSIHPQTGLITTIENYAASVKPATMAEARTLARQSKSMGGR